MFGISGEHLLILGIVLLIFGPKRLPELGNTMGKAIRNFKDSLSGVEEARYRRLDEESKQHVHASTVASASNATPGATQADPASAPDKNDPHKS